MPKLSQDGMKFIRVQQLENNKKDHKSVKKKNFLLSPIL